MTDVSDRDTDQTTANLFLACRGLCGSLMTACACSSDEFTIVSLGKKFILSDGKMMA